jgi:hypothetical protein
MSRKLAWLEWTILGALRGRDSGLTPPAVRRISGLSAVEVAVGLGLLVRGGMVQCDPGLQVYTATAVGRGQRAALLARARASGG